MADNNLMSVKQKINAAITMDKMEECIREVLDGTDLIYSYIVYAEYDECNLSNYIVQYNLSQNEDKNTLKTEDVLNEILDIIAKNKDTGKKVIGYGQPSLEIMLDTYEPLIHKLAKYQGERWRRYEHDDLCQICRLAMIKLYRKGYYIHRRLLQRAFENEIWMEVKRHRDDPPLVSFEDVFFATISGDSEKLIFADIVPDKDLIQKEEDERDEEVTKLIFNEVKDIIVELIGIRQWNELMRDYGNKHTTSWSRKMMQKIKNHFNMLGISRKDFNNKYYD